MVLLSCHSEERKLVVLYTILGYQNAILHEETAGKYCSYVKTLVNNLYYTFIFIFLLLFHYYQIFT